MYFAFYEIKLTSENKMKKVAAKIKALTHTHTHTRKGRQDNKQHLMCEEQRKS